MKRSFFFTILLIWAISQPRAQNSDIPRLIQVLKSAEDTFHIKALNDLARLYIPDSLEKADDLADQALALSRKKSFTKGKIDACRNKGLIADYRGNIEEAVVWYDRGIEAAAGDPAWSLERIGLLLNKGVAYYYGGDLGRALEYYIEAEALCRDFQNHPLYAKILNNLAVVYRNLNRHEEAIRIYERSVVLKRNLGDSLGLANSLNNIGIVYAHLEKHAETANYLNAAREIYASLNEWGEAHSVHLSLAASLYELDRNQEAKELLIRAFDSGQLSAPLHTLIESKLLLASIYVAEAVYEAANDALTEVEEALASTNFSDSRLLFYELKAYTESGLNHPGEAYDALLKHKLLADTLRSAERQQLEKEMETKYLTREKESQIEIQQLQLAKSKRERTFYLFALIGLTVIMVLFFWLFRQRQRANRLLSEKNRQIQKALEEKEILLKEIHHRVKNNLQIISSLLSLQSRRIEDAKALEAIQEGRNRVQSMALIHQNLYQDEDLVGVDAKDYVDKLADSLLVNYQVNEQKIVMKKDIDTMKLDVDTIIPLGLILNELITNALKYAFREKESGYIQIVLKKAGRGLHLRVSDNGAGLPPGFKSDQSDSLGFRLVRAFAQKLHASLDISNRNGAHIELLIPSLKVL